MLLMRVLLPFVVAAGAVLAVSAPANAVTTVKLDYKTPEELESLCIQVDGDFLDLGGGDSVCVLPGGEHFMCFASTNSCVYVFVWVRPTGGREIAWPDDYVLQDATTPPTPPGPRFHLVPNIATVVNR
jgi:hypothetical protein